MEHDPNSVIQTRHIIQAISEGSTLQKAVDCAGISLGTFYNVLSSVRGLFQDYLQARVTRSDLEVDEALEIADDKSIDPQQARNMIDIRKWRASKHNPTIYGEKLEITGHQTISINDALSEARSRLIIDVTPTISSSAEHDIFS